MKILRTRRTLPQLRGAALSALMLTATMGTMAGPGAHGPNGEHLDSPAMVRVASALPRVEAKSESFELVAELRPTALAIVVDRYETNEPVLGATLEVESGSLKAVAAFREEQGDYAVTDAAMLKALAAPGEHGLVFTLVAGNDSDLLDGTLVTSAAGSDTASAVDKHGHAHEVMGRGHDHPLERAAWAGAGAAALGLIGAIAWWRQRRRSPGKLQGGV